MPAPAKRPAESATEMVQVALPNDANPLGCMLGGAVMHLIDIAGAIAAHRHARLPLVTAAVDNLQFLHPIPVGDLVILRAVVTATFRTSLEVQVEVFSEATLTGERRQTSVAYLTFVTADLGQGRADVPPLLVETDEEKQRAHDAETRRAARLKARKPIARSPDSPIARSSITQSSITRSQSPIARSPIANRPIADQAIADGPIADSIADYRSPIADVTISSSTSPASPDGPAPSRTRAGRGRASARCSRAGSRR